MTPKTIQTPLKQNRPIALMTLLILYFICNFLYSDSEYIMTDVKKSSKDSFPVGFWMQGNKKSGYMLTRNKYLIYYTRVGKRRINSDNIADDVMPHISMYECDVSKDTLNSLYSMIRYKVIDNDTLIFYLLDRMKIDTLTRSKDQFTPVYVKCLNRRVYLTQY